MRDKISIEEFGCEDCKWKRYCIPKDETMEVCVEFELDGQESEKYLNDLIELNRIRFAAQWYEIYDGYTYIDEDDAGGGLIIDVFS